MRLIDADKLKTKIRDDTCGCVDDAIAIIDGVPTENVVSEDYYNVRIKELNGQISELETRNAVQKETIKKLMGDRANATK